MEKQYKYFTFIAVLFVTVLLTSNITSTKLTTIGSLTFDGGTVLFPLSYIFGDILTEVYGYKNAKKIIWMGFIGALMMVLTIVLVGQLPPAADWGYQQDYQNILMATPRIILASLIAYTAGEFSNSYLLAKLKIKTKGKLLAVRTISSTIIGQAIDTALFVTIAFASLEFFNVSLQFLFDSSTHINFFSAVFTPEVLWAIFVSNYIFKVCVEILLTPITISIIKFLKKKEHEDYYDHKTNFNPFSIQ